VSYDIIEINNEARATSVNFSYDLGAGAIAVPVINYTTGLAATGTALITTPRSINLTGVNLANGATIELTWNFADAAGSGSRDEVGLDNIELGGAVAPTVSVGFAQASSSGAEGNAGGSGQTIDVTMPVAPSAADVVVSIADLGTSSATFGTDYIFPGTVSLTFPTTGTYPLTRSVFVTVAGDVVVEPNEFIDLSLSLTSGSAITSQTTHRFFINNDDTPTEPGLVVNEVSQGENTGSGRYEYIELVVVGTPGETVDLRGWIIDDNSGIFTAGAGSQLGIAEGHIKFTNVCTWEKVPVGSIILVYSIDVNSIPPTQTYNAAIANAFPGGDDPTDANQDFTYVIGIDQYTVGNCVSAAPNLYFSSDCSFPANVNFDQYLPATYSNPDWATITLRNSGDAVQTRKPDATYFHGLSYGSSTGGSCSFCNFSVENHPEFAIKGNDALVFDTLTYGASQRVYSLINTVNTDYRDIENWNTAAVADNVSQTPGAANSIANDNWIQSLRDPFEVVTSDDSYTCDLRGLETRSYLGTNDSLILWIENNTSFDHGPLTAQTIFNPTGPFQNLNITGSPYFAAKQFRADPTNTNTMAPDDYDIRLYLDNSDLNELAAYINTQTGTSYTGTALIPLLRMYRVPGTTLLPSNTNGAGVQEKVPTTGTYNGTQSFQNQWQGFSAFGLGVPELVLSSGQLELEAKRDGQHVALTWNDVPEDAMETILYKIQSGEKQIIQQPELGSMQGIDYRPNPGVNSYQLAAQLPDGSMQWSNIAEVVMNKGLLSGLPFPQPAQNTLHFPVSLPVGAQATILLYDMHGKKVLQKQLEVSEQGLLTISTAGLRVGAYAYSLRSSSEVVTGKVLVGMR
jgi:hypothetical protein